jgi:hypothetical protein
VYAGGERRRIVPSLSALALNAGLTAALLGPLGIRRNGSPTPEEVKLSYIDDRGDAVEQATRLDFRTYMVDDILVKVDRASMANSLEVRCPLLDHKFLELAARIPVRVSVDPYPLEAADQALVDLAHDRVRGAAVLRVRQRGERAPFQSTTDS